MPATPAVPGRKTDVRDCEWLADLLRHGLLRASFIPPLEIRELRELTRYRQTIIKEHTAVANRIQKLIESGNIKLGQVITDVLGVSGRLMGSVARNKFSAIIHPSVHSTLIGNSTCETQIISV
jgi:Transposase